ncbi:MAG TPA: NnrS family protein [Rubrivivax sp.]|nr:NnrS family protein [Rubrivivax sp.]
MTHFITIDEPLRLVSPPAGCALWQTGFRPFYLLASTFAAVSIGLWAAQLGGWLPRPYLSGALWHAHEMLFGFTVAVIVGFLFTAGRNWTQQPTPSGPVLMALAALWLAGRVLVLTPHAWAAALVNAAFPIAAAILLAVPLWKSRNRRNLFFVGLLLLLGLANIGIHLSQLGVIALPPRLGLRVALDVVLFIVVVMAGRVIPMFTNNGVAGAGAVRDPRVERFALGSVLLLLLIDALGVEGALPAAVAMVGAVAHAWRLMLWKPWRTLRVPLVCVLHAACAWIPLHLVLRATGELGWTSAAAATHALTVGAIGGLVIGMMTRTARGHTGRLLRADGFDVACYGLVLLAGVVRVVPPLAEPVWSVPAMVGSAALWSLGFALYAVRYAPMLWRPRLDGQAG